MKFKSFVLTTLILTVFAVPNIKSQNTKHYVPSDKNLSQEWKDRLYAKGERKVYRGDELYTIGMPCGGLAAGQLYVRGDGTLARWWIFSDYYETTFYKKIPFTNYKTYRPASEISQGFMISAQAKGEARVTLPLSQGGFDDIGFVGEYPIATINYVGAKKDLPVSVESEVFSPFIPLDSKNSALPATILSYKVTNTSGKKVDIDLGGWLQNGALPKADSSVYAKRENRVIKRKGYTSSFLTLVHPEGDDISKNHYSLIEDFEGKVGRADGTSIELGNLSNWKVEGDAFGYRAKSLAEVQSLGGRDFMYHFKGTQGDHVLFSQMDGRDKKGAVSRQLVLSDNYLSFLISGGKNEFGSVNGATCVNLLINGEVVKTATGSNNWVSKMVSWNISDYRGQNAEIRIIDSHAGAAIAVDYFRLSNYPMEKGKSIPSEDVSYGNMAITVLSKNAVATAKCNDGYAFDMFLQSEKNGVDSEKSFITDTLLGAVATSFSLQPNESKTVRFVVSWYFPNLRNNSPGCSGDVGRMYSNWFESADDVASYINDNYKYLSEETHKYRDAMYLNSTLPYWFLQRTASSSANMASTVVEWWRNGRMYAYEGAGFCFGTCGHVWNYAQTPSRLFPEFERSVRKMQDFNMNVSQNESGRINFRAYKDNSESFDNWGYIPDAQAGYVLKAYREHLMSADDSFLIELWPNIKLALEYLMERDARHGELDGILDGLQHLTDNLGWGPNTFSGSLYLGALRATEEMAIIIGDDDFSKQCHILYESGREWTIKNLWNGEYFIHKYSPAPDDALPNHRKPKEQSRGKSFGDGCLSDQVFGQNWAHQVGLGYIYPKSYVQGALSSVYKYNWAPDVKTIYDVMKRRFIFLAEEGESGMVGLTYPLLAPPANRPTQNDDPWTGYEYQVASHMLREGMIEEGLSIAYGVHHRYDGVRHNPWNEIEGGDHYTRSMSSWGMLLNISGFVYDGPAGKIGFSPHMNADDFKSFFTAAEGWGSISQKRKGDYQENTIELLHGTLRVNKLSFEVVNHMLLKDPKIFIDGKEIASSYVQDGTSITINLNNTQTVEEGTICKVYFAN